MRHHTNSCELSQVQLPKPVLSILELAENVCYDPSERLKIDSVYPNLAMPNDGRLEAMLKEFATMHVGRSE